MRKEDLFAYGTRSAQMAFDIPDFINKLPEPQRSFCHAMLIEGESTKTVALRFNVTPKTVLRKTRKALAPLAVQYDISAAKKFLPVSGVSIRVKSAGKVVAHRQAARPASSTQSGRTAAGGQGGQGDRFSRRPRCDSTTREVVEKHDTLSFLCRAERKNENSAIRLNINGDMET